ncbi:hypothetical protein Acr_00g0013020 [Actinidia rufa]|uniref:Uncharacterized protein n=1 Tax=Actinidia rufa TaxID=165716 RepID=A0A7J0DBB1_9ERIC|nr:hypothetical protein Acr_00g0013020 [Actinidia rufa]
MNSTRDTDGHGLTHPPRATGTTWGGLMPPTSATPRATAQGVVSPTGGPVAMYTRPSCVKRGGFTSDILAAIDQAITIDGVDTQCNSDIRSPREGHFRLYIGRKSGPYLESLTTDPLGQPCGLMRSVVPIDREFRGIVILAMEFQFQGLPFFQGIPSNVQVFNCFHGHTAMIPRN